MVGKDEANSHNVREGIVFSVPLHGMVYAIELEWADGRVRLYKGDVQLLR